MKPLPSFRFHTPTTKVEALQLLKILPKAKPIAGGTDLLILLRDNATPPKHLVDIKDLKELNYIRMDDGEITIGAATTRAQILHSKLIAENAAVLLEAVGSIGSVQIRNQATLGGNLCNASPAADTAPPLLVLEAKVTIASVDGTREIPLANLFVGPKMSSLQPGELLTRVRFQSPPSGTGSSFQKLGRRRSMTLAIINAAAYLKVDGNRCQEVRIALGSVADTPRRVIPLEEKLKGQHLSKKRIGKATDICSNLIEPVDDIRASSEYRRLMSQVFARRVIVDAWERARRNQR